MAAEFSMMGTTQADEDYVTGATPWVDGIVYTALVGEDYALVLSDAANSRVLFSRPEPILEPDLDSDGSRVAFTKCNGGDLERCLRSRRVLSLGVIEGGDFRETRTFDIAGNGRFGVDGSLFFVQRDRDGNRLSWNLKQLMPDGRVQVLAPAGGGHAPRLSPDRRWIAFHSPEGRGHESEGFLVEVATGRRHSIGVGRFADVAPCIAEDGTPGVAAALVGPKTTEMSIVRVRGE